jgi:uncharacterized protein YqjF (DUF2071 family)
MTNSDSARERFLAAGRKPLFLGNWERVLFIHYETDSETLQRQIPFELDIWEGSAFVSIVAFSMRRLRLAFGGKLVRRLLWPIANHEFLNVRTYVKHDSQPGIHFLAEWVNNPMSLVLGPGTYGLPYRYGRIAYKHLHERRCLTGKVGDSFSYAATISPGTGFEFCQPGSLDEFLLERYSAFTHRRGTSRRFDIWHAPWPQCLVDARVADGLLSATGSWFEKARLVGANYSAGVQDIWMGAPRRIKPAAAC